MNHSRFRISSVLAALLISTSTLSGCASILVSKGLAQTRGTKDIVRAGKNNRDLWDRLVPGISHWSDSLRYAGVMRDTFITRDGVQLHALYAAAESPTPNTAIVVHGYSAGPDNVMALVRMYRDSLGFNVLAPSLRNLGYSEGDHIQMGWDDRLDLLHWSETAHCIFTDTAQVFHGVSMGAATVMMASGEQTPDYVRGFVEDCGYTSVYDEFRYISGKWLKRGGGLTERVNRIYKRRFGSDLRDASSVRQLAKCTKPMLFIHGDKDLLVPFYMQSRNYEAKENGYREIWVSEGSVHSRSFPDRPAEYTARVREFVFRHVLGK